MKLILLSLLLVTNFALAQDDPADGAITQPTAAQQLNEKNKDIKGSLAKPTPEQKKHVLEAAKKAKKKKKAKAKQKAAKKNSDK